MQAGDRTITKHKLTHNRTPQPRSKAYKTSLANTLHLIKTNHRGLGIKALRYWTYRRVKHMTVPAIIEAEKALGLKATESTVQRYITAYDEYHLNAYDPETKAAAIEELTALEREYMVLEKKVEDEIEGMGAEPPEWANTGTKIQAWTKEQMSRHSAYQILGVYKANRAALMAKRHMLEGLTKTEYTEPKPYSDDEVSSSDRTKMLEGKEVDSVIEETTKKTRTVKLKDAAGAADHARPLDGGLKDAEVIDG